MQFIALALALCAPWPCLASRGHFSLARQHVQKGDKVSCGPIAAFNADKLNSEIKEYKDKKKDFKAGDKVAFKCVKGFTIDGTKDGDAEFDVECMEAGYYKTPKICIKASKCGKIPKD